MEPNIRLVRLPDYKLPDREAENTAFLQDRKISNYVKNLFRLHPKKQTEWAYSLVVRKFGVQLEAEKLNAWREELTQGAKLSSYKSNRLAKRRGSVRQQNCKIKKAHAGKPQLASQLLSRRLFRSKLKNIIKSFVFPLMVWFGIRKITFASKRGKFTTSWTELDGKQASLDGLK